MLNHGISTAHAIWAPGRGSLPLFLRSPPPPEASLFGADFLADSWLILRSRMLSIPRTIPLGRREHNPASNTAGPYVASLPSPCWVSSSSCWRCSMQVPTTPFHLAVFMPYSDIPHSSGWRCADARHLDQSPSIRYGCLTAHGYSDNSRLHSHLLTEEASEQLPPSPHVRPPTEVWPNCPTFVTTSLCWRVQICSVSLV